MSSCSATHAKTARKAACRCVSAALTPVWSQARAYSTLSSEVGERQSKMRCRKVADWIAAAGATVVVMFRKPKLGQVKSAGQVKAGGLVPDKLGATEVLEEAKKALESGRRSGPMRSEPVSGVEVDAGQEEAVVVAVEVLVVLTRTPQTTASWTYPSCTARVVAMDG
jgi:hypothetical protein